MPCATLRPRAVLCCAVLCCCLPHPRAVLCCPVLCCAVLCYCLTHVLCCPVLCYCLTQVHAAFSERRKLLRNNLMSLYGAKQVGRS